MKLYLDRKDIEAILVAHANRLMSEAGFNSVDWDNKYSTLHGATLEHSDVPQEHDDGE